MLTIASLLWAPNEKSFAFSRCYSPAWVDKLYRGFRRNLTAPFRFVCFTDRRYDFAEQIGQQIVDGLGAAGYGDCIRPYALNAPMILVGLDTVITGNCDALAAYCFTATKPAFPLDPYRSLQVCNGVGLVPAGHAHIARDHRGENDMDWIRRFDHAVIDELFPGQCVSYKGHVKQCGLGDARIVYFHGESKAHELHEDWLSEHWV